MKSLIERRQRLYPSFHNHGDTSKFSDAKVSMNLNKELNATVHKEHFFAEDLAERINKFRSLMLDKAEDKDLDGLEEDFDEIFGTGWDKPIPEIYLFNINFIVLLTPDCSCSASIGIN